jgi:hypothetical protein
MAVGTSGNDGKFSQKQDEWPWNRSLNTPLQRGLLQSRGNMYFSKFNGFFFTIYKRLVRLLIKKQGYFKFITFENYM